MYNDSVVFSRVCSGIVHILRNEKCRSVVINGDAGISRNRKKGGGRLSDCWLFFSVHTCLVRCFCSVFVCLFVFVEKGPFDFSSSFPCLYCLWLTMELFEALLFLEAGLDEWTSTGVHFAANLDVKMAEAL